MAAKKRVPVAGAAGMVGRSAVEHLSNLGDREVVAISRRKPDYRTSAQFVSVDLTDANRCVELPGEMQEQNLLPR